MKKILLTITMLALIGMTNLVTAQTPIWAWAKSAGGVSNEYSNAVCTDASGNVYITGTFQSSTITFGSSTLHNEATGTLDIFVVKYDPSGNVLWAKSAGGTSMDYAYGICADIGGNVYITGYFNSPSITFGTITLTNSGTYSDILVVKYNNSGNVVWAKSAAGNDADCSYGICTDANSNVYITGMFQSSPFTFGSYSLTNSSMSGYYDIFIAKYDSNGNVLWAKGMGGIRSECGQGVCTDLNGNVYITGYFQQSATFGGITITGTGNSTLFVAKYNTDGTILWAKSVRALSMNSYVNAGGITSDVSDNVYITGYFDFSLILGSDTLSTSGNQSIFLAKYDASGNAIWGRSPGGTGSRDNGSGICINSNGKVFLTGYFVSFYLNFGGFQVLNDNVGYTDIFVAEYDANGNAIGATGIGGQDYDYGMGICKGLGGDVYVTGYFGSYNLSFGNTMLTNNGSYDTFLAKLSTLEGIEDFPKKDNSSLILYPNPTATTFTLQLPSDFSPATLQIFNALGALVYEQSITQASTLINLNKTAGIYFVKVDDGDRVVMGKLIVE